MKRGAVGPIVLGPHIVLVQRYSELHLLTLNKPLNKHDQAPVNTEQSLKEFISLAEF